MSLLIKRRDCLAGAVALGAAGVVPGTRAQAQVWPARPIRFVTQSAAGDPVELRLREFLQGLSAQFKNHPMIVDNKPGAGGMIAHQALLNAPADGHTVMLANAAIAIFPGIYRKLPYNPLKDFQPVAFSGLAPIGLAIPASRPEKTLKDWLIWARQQKGKLNYGSPGNGSVSHVYGFQFNEDVDLDASHIPYKGAAPALLDMVGGQVHFMLLDIFSLRPLLSKGELRVLAVTGDERSKFLPEVPSFTELGYKGYDRMGWTGYYVRAGTNPAIVDQLAQAINNLNAGPEWSQKRDLVWSEWKNLKPAELLVRIRHETETYTRLIQKIGFYAD